MKKPNHNIDKDDPTQKIINVVKDYLTRETNNALLITGKWGVGKTYFFNNILSKKIKEINIKGKTKSNYTSIRISLFGVANIDDIERRIVTPLSALLIKGVIELGKGALNYILTLTNLKELISEDISKLINEFKTTNSDIIKSKANTLVICFDDLERVSEDFHIGDLIGYVNNLTENYDFKVILIGNTDEIKDNNFNEIKEKLIGVEIDFDNDIKSIFENIVKNKFHEKESQNTYEKFLVKEKKDFICSFFNEDYKNIRTLLIVLECYKHIYSAIIGLNSKPLEAYREDLIKNTLLFTIAIAIEFKKGKLTKKDKNELNNDILSLLEIEENVLTLTSSDANTSLNEEKGSGVIENITKYYNNEQTYFFYESIFDYIIGINTFIEDTFVEEVKKKYGMSEDEKIPEHYKVYNKISPSYRIFLKDEEYNSLLNDVLGYVDKGLYNLEDYLSIYQQALSCGNPLELDENYLKERIKKGIQQGEEHFIYNPNLKWKNDTIRFHSFNSIEKEIIAFCHSVNERRKEKQYQDEISFLKELLNKGNYEDFSKKIKKNYENTAIFNQIGADLVFKLYKENLKLRIKVYELFFYRYKEHSDIVYSELDFITKLNTLISKEANTLQKGVEWNSYDIFRNFLNEVNNRYEKFNSIAENSLSLSPL
jgi:KAP family P-loop domain protein